MQVNCVHVHCPREMRVRHLQAGGAGLAQCHCWQTLSEPRLRHGRQCTLARCEPCGHQLSGQGGGEGSVCQGLWSLQATDTLLPVEAFNLLT